MKSDCICGCGVVAELQKKIWSGEHLPHCRGCMCRRCQGRRHRKRAGVRERQIAKDLGGQRNPGSGAWGGEDVNHPLLTIEETMNQSIVGTVRRWWESQHVMEKTAKIKATAKEQGLTATLVLAWDNKPRLVVMPYEDFVELIKKLR